MSSMIRRRLAVFLAVTAIALSLPTAAWAGAPNNPTGLTATAGNTEVALAWALPSSDGGGGPPRGLGRPH